MRIRRLSVKLSGLLGVTEDTTVCVNMTITDTVSPNKSNSSTHKQQNKQKTDEVVKFAESFQSSCTRSGSFSLQMFFGQILLKAIKIKVDVFNNATGNIQSWFILTHVGITDWLSLAMVAPSCWHFPLTLQPSAIKWSYLWCFWLPSWTLTSQTKVYSKKQKPLFVFYKCDLLCHIMCPAEQNFRIRRSEFSHHYMRDATKLKTKILKMLEDYNLIRHLIRKPNLVSNSLTAHTSASEVYLI